MRQAEDFREESQRVERLIGSLDSAAYDRPTLFKGWTINQIIRHLHVWNRAAYLSLTDEAALQAFLARAFAAVASGGLPPFEEEYLSGLSGRGLFDDWRAFYHKLADAFADVDPAKRLAWAGPSMSARSSITARLMETWSHAQAIYDDLGVERESSDGIENIVVLGLNTYGWTFANRKREAPEPQPRLDLIAPSGARWQFGDEGCAQVISGSAQEFCQVVTQTRNIADTELESVGENAREWMQIAQCFAGPPMDPPAAGTRRKREPA